MSNGGTTADAILTMTAQQDELALILALAPPVTGAARREMDRARTEAIAATRKAAGCQIRQYAEDERRCTDCGHRPGCACAHWCEYGTEDEGGWPVQGETGHDDDYSTRMEEAMFGPQDADLDEDA